MVSPSFTRCLSHSSRSPSLSHSLALLYSHTHSTSSLLILPLHLLISLPRCLSHALPRICSLSHTRALSVSFSSLSPSLTRSLSRTPRSSPLSLSLVLPLTQHSLSHDRSFSHVPFHTALSLTPHIHTYTPSLHTHTFAHTLVQPRSLSLVRSLSHTHSFSRTRGLSHIRSHLFSLSQGDRQRERERGSK